MSEQADGYDFNQDRRLQSLVYELDKKVHALEMSDTAHKIEIATLKGEITGLRSSSATSAEVTASAKLIDVKLDHLHKDLAAIKAIMLWFAGAVGIGVIAAVLRMVLKDGGGL